MNTTAMSLSLILDSVQARREGKINETECLDEIERVARQAEEHLLRERVK